jgi:hypothetical protein
VFCQNEFLSLGLDVYPIPHNLTFSTANGITKESNEPLLSAGSLAGRQLRQPLGFIIGMALAS